MSLSEEMLKIERVKLKEAIVRENGNLKRAAETLGIPHSTLTSKLDRHHPDLQERARRLRAKKGNESGRGRPRLQDKERSKKAVERALRKSGYCYAEAARILKIPASTVQMLVQRYDLPVGPKGEGL